MAADRVGGVMDPRKAREALRKQGIYVHESDPILDMAAVCDAAMGDTLKAIEGIVKAAADRTSASATQAVDASKGAAEAIISQGAAFLVEQFREVMQGSNGHDAGRAAPGNRTGRTGEPCGCPGCLGPWELGCDWLGRTRRIPPRRPRARMIGEDPAAGLVSIV